MNHAYDLIKKKLIQTSPSQALRFSNLYSKLLSLPVLNQKWAILYLLYQLADSPDPNEPLPLTPLRQPVQRPALRRVEKDRASKVSTPPASGGDEEAALRDAFAPGGLKRFPPARSTHRPEESDQQAAPEVETTAAAAPKRDVSLKSTLLASSYVEIDPPETSLLRDLPFTLQGLNSATLAYPRDTVLKLPATLPAPIISLLHRLAEPSLLYRGLSAFVSSPARGLLDQSLRAAVGGELRSYLSLVATLEGQIRRALASLDASAPRGGIGKAGVTLKRCVVWTREATMGLRLMSLLAEESRSKRGGQLVSLIHGFASSHGDPTVAAFADRLLSRVTRPFYDILRRWIYDGELSDPFLEFFVREQDHTQPQQQQQAQPTGDAGQQQQQQQTTKEKGGVGLSSVWNDKYEVVESMIPSIISGDFAQKVFLIGKSLNFIRHSCGDAAWVEEYSKAASKELRYGDTATLEAWIDEAYKTTMRRLMQLMRDKFHLLEHLAALKKYMLLGQGDFVALLMESLAADLDRPAGAQYRHTLTAQLEHAIRGSNAQYDPPEVLRRLDARMLQLSHGDIGWDCFTLEYKIDAPVDCVVTEWGSRQYLKVFNFLWRVKRGEFALASTWRKCMTGRRGVLQTADPAVLQTWKTTRGCLAEMIHFVGQLQYYILFEVIESSWEALREDVARDDCTLDDLIRAHSTFLRSVTHRGLLGSPRRQFLEARAQAHALGVDAVEDRNTYMLQLADLLRTMLAYRDSVDGLYSWSVSDFTRRQEADVRHATTTDPSPSSSSSAAAAVESELPALQARLRQLGRSFQTRLELLLGDLAYQSDTDMRFLGVAMNFNDVYQPQRKKTKVPTSAASTSATAAKAEARSETGGR